MVETADLSLYLKRKREELFTGTTRQYNYHFSRGTIAQKLREKVGKIPKKNKFIPMADRVAILRDPEYQAEVGKKLLESLIYNEKVYMNSLSLADMAQAVSRDIAEKMTEGKRISPSGEEWKMRSKIEKRCEEIHTEFDKIIAGVACGTITDPVTLVREFEQRDWEVDKS